MMRNICFLGLICSILFLGSCEKERMDSLDGLEAAIIGSWSRTDVTPSGRSEADFRYFDMVITYSFDAKDNYSYTVDFYGFKDENPEELIGSSMNKGSYEVRGDSVFIKAKVHTSWEKGFKPNPKSILLNGETYGNRFEIIDQTLTLFYISYPADAPVPTQMSYTKVSQE